MQMMSRRMGLFGLLVALCSMSAWAVGDSVLVTAVQGAIRLEAGASGKMALDSFVRLSEGDRLTLPAGAQLRLVYVGAGRQEQWKGAGSLVIGSGESKVLAGKPELIARALPPEVTRQLNRTPTTSGEGRTGMIRLRSIPPVDAVSKLEREAESLRKEFPSGDLTPEMFLLAGLLDLREYERIESELKRLGETQPRDAGVQALRDLYTKALARAQQAPSGK